MKNTRIIFAAAAVAMLFVTSCQKESSVKQEFSASIETGASDIKTTLVDSDLRWQHDTDQVSITSIATTTENNQSSTSTTTSTFTATAHTSYPDNLSYANLELNEGEAELAEASTNASVTYKAIYPATIAGSNGTVVILPKVQASTSGELTGYPMYAESTSKSLQFKNLCSVLKLELKGSGTINKIEVVTDQYINGPFTISYPNTTPLTRETNTTSSLRNSKVTTLTMSSPVTLNSTDSSCFYIYLPVQQYNFIKVNVYNTDGQIYSKSATSSTGVTLERSKYYPLAFSNVAFTPSLLNGKFSVAANIKVSFSKGNLLRVSHTESSTDNGNWLFHNYSYTSTDTYKFAENQYDRNEGSSSSYDTWLFEWGIKGTSANQNNSGSTSFFERWKNYSDNEHTHTATLQNNGNINWRCLTQGEWDHLLRIRALSTASSSGAQIHYYDKDGNPGGGCFTLGTVNGIHGMLIFPDVFYWPLDNKQPSQFGLTATYSNWNSISLTLDEWRIVEGAGCVFLPTTGDKNNIHNNGSTTISNTNTIGTYWSSTYNNGNPHYLKFGPESGTSAFSDNNNGDIYGHYYAIRLVKNN